MRHVPVWESASAANRVGSFSSCFILAVPTSRRSVYSHGVNSRLCTSTGRAAAAAAAAVNCLLCKFVRAAFCAVGRCQHPGNSFQHVARTAVGCGQQAEAPAGPGC